ncbi:hypothetical protein LX64_01861 [Chitinophaga skermanii]|uniref:Uncharacterized protein n=1 Tax=Chitinophaga skermanii TaxID=331697 RepID=A0A327QSW7_9BACT|nr:hypothetical protein [Chitinophaga skermanii]RAJ06734.1 hypothetical protein LX64_01861 [Chitinophaga skermanii]
MNQILSYQSKSFQDKFTLFSNGQQVGNLYKSEWLGNPIHGSLYGHNYRFQSQGILNYNINVFDADQLHMLGVVHTVQWLRWFPKAEFVLNSGTRYTFKVKGFYNTWVWEKDGVEVMRSAENYLLFKREGTIRVSDHTNPDNALLAALGIHLRNKMKNAALIPSIAITILMLSWVLNDMF